MGEGGEAAVTKVSPAVAEVATRPSITVPPRAPFESYFSGGSMAGFSPGPMTLMSSFFSPDSNSCSFSQLLAGAMASPIARPGFLTAESKVQDTVSKEMDSEDGIEKGLRDYKQNRPMGLMVPTTNSPMFRFPPGLSPGGFLNSPGFLSPLQSPFGMSHQQALAHVTAQAAFAQSYNQMQADYQLTSAAPESEPSSKHVNTLQLKEADSASVEPHKPASFAGDKPDSDGYNWRKYGQKVVKAKEHPRSYYKCTYPDCPVKKKVERAQDGHVDEITYKGQHNHDLPQPNVRTKDVRTTQQGSKSGLVKPEPPRVQNQTTMETLHVPQASSQVVNPELPTHVPAINIEADEMEDSAVVIDEVNDNDDEPNAKRRNVEVGERVLPAPAFKTVTEPKIIVHTRSEVDILIDGYKWRKYGQKVVKGNSHPRSYYRCTYPGCNVRKHVERSSADDKAVVTTYEGKHSHDTPIAKGGGGGGGGGHNSTNGASKLQKPVPLKPSV